MVCGCQFRAGRPRMNATMAALLNKRDRPELFCPTPRCIWRLSSGPCPLHQGGVHLRNPWAAPLLPDRDPPLEKLAPGEPDPRD